MNFLFRNLHYQWILIGTKLFLDYKLLHGIMIVVQNLIKAKSFVRIELQCLIAFTMDYKNNRKTVL